MASESKKSFSPMLIYCNGIIFHLGFKDSGFSPPLIHLGNIKNVDFCPICPPLQFNWKGQSRILLTSAFRAPRQPPSPFSPSRPSPVVALPTGLL